MADYKNGSTRTKADVIIEKVSRFDERIAGLEKQVGALSAALDGDGTHAREAAEKSADGLGQLKTEIKFVSAQLESVCVMLDMSLKKLSAEVAELKKGGQPDLDELASRVAAKIVIPEIQSPAPQTAQPLPELDYDALGFAVAKSIYVPRAVAEEIDYDDLSSKIAEKMPAPEFIVPAAEQPQTEIDYDLLAAKVAEAVNAEPVSCDYIAARVAEQIVVPAAVAEGDGIDVEELSSKIAAKLNLSAAGTAPAEQAAEASVEEACVSEEAADEGKLAEDIAARLAPAITEAIDADDIADRIAKRVGSISPEEFEINVDDDGCDSLAKAIEGRLDYDALAAKVAERIAPVMEADAADNIDADELANAISDKLTVSAAVNEDALAEKAAAILSNYMPEVDNADIADKVIAGVIPAIPNAAVVDHDRIAGTVAAKVAEDLDYGQLAEAVASKAQEFVDGEAIAESVSAKILENQNESDYDIVIDDEGVATITDNINRGVKDEIARLDEERREKAESEINAVKEEYSARFDKISGEIEELKKLLSEDDGADYDIVVDDEGVATISGNINEGVKGEIARLDEERREKAESEINAIKEEYSARFDKLDGEIEELKRLLAAGAAVAVVSGETAAASAEPAEDEEEEEETEECLVTVSDVVGGEEQEETQPDDGVIAEIVSDIDEEPADGEIMPDGIGEEDGGGVDFANMMKYNRSFIARIIQGTDEQKNFYGQVKTALLSYKKVNSNIAWGAERFNKGRETIARFKIRGKTLCLYLALDPKEFEYSVYHQVDVSDNKSMHGTPMMVKIKSPRGVKKAIRLIDAMLAKRDGVKRTVAERDYAAMYPYETIEELIEDGLVKDVSKK